MNEIESALKIPAQKQLVQAGALWRRKNIDHLPLKVTDEQITGIYAEGLELLTFLPEDERINVLNLYSAALGINLRKEAESLSSPNLVDSLKRPSASHNAFLRQIALAEANSLSPIRFEAKTFIQSLVSNVSFITPETMLYIISHHDLATTLPPRFLPVIANLKEYLFDQSNAPLIIEQDNWIHLRGLTRAHAKFLVPPQEIAKEELDEPNSYETEIAVYAGEFDESKQWMKSKFDRKQQGKSKRGKNRFDDE